MSQIGSGLPRLLAERYELSEPLASGGMTSVWRGHDRVLGRDVAVKVLRPELAADPAFRARFHEEAVNAARLTHPNVVALYDTGDQEGVAYIVMELVDGRPLRQVIDQEGPLPPGRAAHLASEALLALDYAHQAGVVHGNLKPGNVLLCYDGTVKVGDFAIAKAATDDDPGRTGELLGATGHLAPEQASGGPIDARTDVYGLGALLYELLTGRPPQHSPSGLTPPRALRAGVPRELDAIVGTALADQPEQRYPTAQAMASALAHSARDGDPLLAPAPFPQQRPPPPPSGMNAPRGFLRQEGRWLGWTLALVALAAVVAILGILLSRNVVPDLTGGGDRARGDTTEPPAIEPLPIAAFSSFDPQGDPTTENDDELPLASDGNPGTAWETDGYNSAGFGGLKSGVGVVLDLGAGAPAASELRVTFSSPGADVEIRYADGQPPGTIDGWSQVDARGGVQREERFDLPDEPHRYYLIWFTRLPPDEGGRFRGGIAETSLVQ